MFGRKRSSDDCSDILASHVNHESPRSSSNRLTNAHCQVYRSQAPAINDAGLAVCRSYQHTSTIIRSNTMDGASSAATVLQLIQVASQVSSAFVRYAISVKEAESCRQKLVEYLWLVTGAATTVKTILESSSTGSAAHDTLVKYWFRDDGPQMQSKKALDNLLSELGARSTKQMAWMEKLKWPVKEKRINSKIQVLEQYRPYFELLLQVDLVYKTKDIQRGIQDVACKAEQLAQHVDRSVKDVGQTVNCLANDIAKSKIEQIDAAQRAVMKSLIEWLDAVDCTVKHESTRGLRQRETCNWLFSVQSFLEWRKSLIHFLWLNGIAGSGKSVLASAVVDEIERELAEGEALAYFYFDFRSSRTTSAMEALRSLLVQFLRNTTTNWLPVFHDLVVRKDRGAEPPADVDMLVNLLQRALKLHRRPIIVIDALDECKQREELLAALTKLNDGHVQLFCVSRPEVAIEEALSYLPLISLSVMEGPLREDMERHIMADLECRRKLRRLGAEQKEEIRRLLLEKAQGMFRWVQCQLDRLESCHSMRAIHHVLHSLPSGLFETYDRILQDIDEKESDGGIVQRVLVWLVVARGPLTLSQLSEALKIDLTMLTLNDADAPMHDEYILDICGSLVSIDKEHGRVTLSHYTVQEYLTATKPGPGIHTKYSVTLPEAHLRVAKLCMHYIIVHIHRLDFVHVECGHPLLKYALWSGRTHIADIPADDDSIIPVLVAWEEYISANVDKFWAIGAGSSFSALETIVVHGSTSLLQRFLNQYPIQFGECNNTLIHAALRGRVGHAELLLDHGIDVNTKINDHWGGIMLPIEAAVRGGNAELVKLFLARGSRIPGSIRSCMVAAGIRGDTILHAALEFPSPSRDEDCLETVKALVEAGCVPESLPCRGGSLIVLAACQGYFPVAEWFLDRGCQLPSDFPLSAIRRTHGGINPRSLVVWSLQHEATANSHNSGSGDNVLHALMGRHHSWQDIKQAIEELISAGCNVDVLLNSENAIGKAPLHIAVERLCSEHVQYLVTRGARVPRNIIHSLVNVEKISNFEPMLHALIQSGLDVNAASISLDFSGNTILHAICFLRTPYNWQLFPSLLPGKRWPDCGDETLSERPLLQKARLLRQAKFDLAKVVDVKNKDGLTALRMALDYELPSPQLISYLLELGETFANVNHLPLANLHWATDMPWYADAVDACRRATVCQAMTLRDVRQVEHILTRGLKFSQQVSSLIMAIAEQWACASITHRNVVFGRDTVKELALPELPPRAGGAVIQRIVFSYAGKNRDGRSVDRESRISRSIRHDDITLEPLPSELKLQRFSSDWCFHWVYQTTTEIFWDRCHASAKGPMSFSPAPGDVLVLKRQLSEQDLDLLPHLAYLGPANELELEFYRIDMYYSIPCRGKVQVDV